MLRFYYLLQVIKDLSDLLGLQQEAIVPEAGFYLKVLGMGYIFCPLATLAWRK